MKSILLVFSFVLLGSVACAHEYFFAFAEVNYNSNDSTLEVTVISSAHETEDALNLEGITIKELEDHYKDVEMIAKLQGFLNEGFSMGTNSVILNFELIGFEVNNRGMVEFYLKSEKTTLSNEYSISFDLLMDQFPDQQNKILLTNESKTITAVFLPNKRTEIIKL